MSIRRIAPAVGLVVFALTSGVLAQGVPTPPMQVPAIREPHHFVKLDNKYLEQEIDTRPTFTLAEQLKLLDRSAGKSTADQWFGQLAEFLKSVGFDNVKNLRGGILEWIDKVDPSQPKY